MTKDLGIRGGVTKDSKLSKIGTVHIRTVQCVFIVNCLPDSQDSREQWNFSGYRKEQGGL
jgi:hypothetical protein